MIEIQKRMFYFIQFKVIRKGKGFIGKFGTLELVKEAWLCPTRRPVPIYGSQIQITDRLSISHC